MNNTSYAFYDQNQQVSKKKKKRKAESLLGPPFHLKDGDTIGIKVLKTLVCFKQWVLFVWLVLETLNPFFFFLPRIFWLTTKGSSSPWRTSRASRGSGSKRSNAGKGGTSLLNLTVSWQSLSGHFAVIPQQVAIMLHAVQRVFKTLCCPCVFAEQALSALDNRRRLAWANPENRR